MDRYNLYKELKTKGFPQGGNGIYLIHPDTDEKVYIPKPEELYTTFIGDPTQWDKLVDAMSKVWIDNRK